MPDASPARARRALLIGINDYSRLRKLAGCVNDVRLMREVLQENFGFPAGNITVLEDAEATRERILAAFDALWSRSRGQSRRELIPRPSHPETNSSKARDVMLRWTGLPSTIADTRDAAADSLIIWMPSGPSSLKSRKAQVPVRAMTSTDALIPSTFWALEAVRSILCFAGVYVTKYPQANALLKEVSFVSE